MSDENWTTLRTEVIFHVALKHGAQANSISKVVEIPAARVAMDRDRCKWRKKLSSLCGMVFNTTPPLVDRTQPQRKTPRITRELKCNNQTHHIRRTFQVSYIQNLEHQWKSRSFSSYKIGMKMLTLPELWLLHDILLCSFRRRTDGSVIRVLQTLWKAKTRIRAQSAQNIANLEPEDRLAQNFEVSKGITVANFQIHETAVNMPHQPTKVKRTTSILEPSLIEPTNVTNCLKQVHQPRRNRGRKGHGLKQIRHGKVFGNFMVGDTRKTCRTHQSTTFGGAHLKTQGSFTGDRWTPRTLWSTS